MDSIIENKVWSALWDDFYECVLKYGDVPRLPDDYDEFRISVLYKLVPTIEKELDES